EQGAFGGDGQGQEAAPAQAVSSARHDAGGGARRLLREVPGYLGGRRALVHRGEPAMKLSRKEFDSMSSRNYLRSKLWLLLSCLLPGAFMMHCATGVDPVRPGSGGAGGGGSPSGPSGPSGPASSSVGNVSSSSGQSGQSSSSSGSPVSSSNAASSSS